MQASGPSWVTDRGGEGLRRNRPEQPTYPGNDMASIAVRVRMRGPTVNRSAGQDAAMRSRLQDTAPFRLPQNLLATFLLSE